jgi:hypothetical protein
MKLNPNQLQEKLQDSRYQDIGALPSQCKGYSWDQLYIRPFKTSEFLLVSKAATLNDMNHMIRAIDLVITQEAKELTIGDFYYVMMWLRIHSLPKTPIVMDWHCEEKVLRHKETGELIYNDKTFQNPENIEDYELIDCDTQTTESIHMTNLEIMSLDDDPEVQLPAGFDFPRAKHIEGIAKSLANPELTMLMSSLQWAAGETIQDRIDSILNDDESGIDRLDTATALNEKFTHGLRETVTLCCRNCRVKVPYQLNMTPLSFFP